jgi:hypothetical protein
MSYTSGAFTVSMIPVLERETLNLGYFYLKSMDAMGQLYKYF